MQRPTLQFTTIVDINTWLSHRLRMGQQICLPVELRITLDFLSTSFLITIITNATIYYYVIIIKTDRKVYVCLYLSFYLSFSPVCVCLSVCLPVCWRIYVLVPVLE